MIAVFMRLIETIRALDGTRAKRNTEVSLSPAAFATTPTARMLGPRVRMRLVITVGMESALPTAVALVFTIAMIDPLTLQCS
ncbi:hypothetical protein D3C81_1733890 [compost metagenome]